MLGEAGAVDYGGDAHYTCFQFGYDWRRSLPENARLLGEFIEEKRREVSTEHARRFGPAAGRAQVKFDIVAHSMGGLLTRYYLRYGKARLPNSDRVPTPTWAGARHVEKVILVATPNAGSIYALSQLHDGLKYPLVHEYPTAMLGTMPAIYQLLPRGRHRSVVDGNGNYADPLDLAFWKQNQLGLLRPEADEDLQKLLPEVPDRSGRLAIARDHLDKCLTEARRFHAALDQPSKPPSNVKLSLFVGDGKKTPQQATFDPDKHTFTFSREEAGDGTVVRSSALLDERGSAAENRTVRLDSPIAWHDIDFIPDDQPRRHPPSGIRRQHLVHAVGAVIRLHPSYGAVVVRPWTSALNRLVEWTGSPSSVTPPHQSPLPPSPAANGAGHTPHRCRDLFSRRRVTVCTSAFEDFVKCLLPLA